MNTSLSNLPWRLPAIASIAFLFVLLIWLGLRDDNPGEGFASGNGRIEAPRSTLPLNWPDASNPSM